MDNIEGVLNTVQVVLVGTTIANFLLNTGRLSPAIELCKECLSLLNSQPVDKDGPITHSILVQQGRLNLLLATTLYTQSKFVEARKFYERAIKIMKTNDDERGKAICYGGLAALLYSFGEYDKCKKYLEKARAIRKQIGDRVGEAVYYRELGGLSILRGNYDKAQEYIKKALAIRTQIGDRKGEGMEQGFLGTVFQMLGNYDQARKYLEKHLPLDWKLATEKEKQPITKTLEQCSDRSVIMTRHKNITRKHLLSRWKLVI